MSMAKQKLKGYYGDITEKQFLRVYEEAARLKGNTAENLIGFESFLSAALCSYDLPEHLEPHTE